MEGENTRRRGSIFITGYVEAKATGLRIASVKLIVSIYSKASEAAKTAVKMKKTPIKVSFTDTP